LISIIVAVAENNAIGKNNQLLWHLPADMKFFKEKTSGHCVITGRKNYESIPEKFRPLPNRTNIVITRQQHYSAPGAIVVHTLEDAIEKARAIEKEEIFIIGGAQIYNEAINKNLVQKLYVTKVLHHFEADAFFPAIDPDKWVITKKNIKAKDNKNLYDMEFYEYVYKK
jgi:dihydrofolate reductase